MVTLENGLQAPCGAEYILEGHVIPGVREPDGPYGEFTGHLSGLRNMVSVEITKVWHRKDPIYEYTSIGMPWTEIDYMFLNARGLRERLLFHCIATVNVSLETLN